MTKFAAPKSTIELTLYAYPITSVADLCAEDRHVPGQYRVHVDASLTEGEQAAAALDLFSVHCPVYLVEDIDVHIVNPEGFEIFKDYSLKNGSMVQHATGFERAADYVEDCESEAAASTPEASTSPKLWLDLVEPARSGTLPHMHSTANGRYTKVSLLYQSVEPTPDEVLAANDSGNSTDAVIGMFDITDVIGQSKANLVAFLSAAYDIQNKTMGIPE